MTSRAASPPIGTGSAVANLNVAGTVTLADKTATRDTATDGKGTFIVEGSGSKITTSSIGTLDAGRSNLALNSDLDIATGATAKFNNAVAGGIANLSGAGKLEV